jgi:pilus assembly protein CpaB
MVLIVIALGCGLVASIAISQVMERGGGGPSQLETVPIYVAMSDIDVNEQLTASNVEMEEWPKTKVPEGATTNYEDIKERFAQTRMYAGEPILLRKLADEISGPAIQIPDGYRVLSLKVRMDTAVSNLVRPGDRVDIFGYFRAGKDIPKTGTREILRNVRVFAVNSETEQVGDQDGETIVAKTVSVLVKQDQVAKLMLATELGTLRLALRRPNEQENRNSGETATIESLFGTRSEMADDRSAHSTGSSKPAGLLQFLSGLKSAASPPAGTTAGSFSPTATAMSMPQQAKPQWEMTLLTPDGGTNFTWRDTEQLPSTGSDGAPGATAGAPRPWQPPAPTPGGGQVQMPTPTSGEQAQPPASAPDAGGDAGGDADGGAEPVATPSDSPSILGDD